MKTWVYDYETLINYTLVCFINKDTKEKRHFSLFDKENIFDDDNGVTLQDFIKNEVDGLIGYNNLAFDSPLLQYCLLNKNLTAWEVYNKAQEIINDKKLKYYHKSLIRELDLLKLWHFDNKAKITSLKDIEFFLERSKVKEMPIHHSETIKESDIPLIIDYCYEDCMATLEFYEFPKTLSAVKLRIDMSKKYGIDFLNMNDVKMGVEIFAYYLAKYKNVPIKRIKNKNTSRSSVLINDILYHDQLNFKTSGFKNLYNSLLKTEIVIDPIEYKNNNPTIKISTFDKNVNFNDMTYSYGLGGIHGAIPGCYYTTNDATIESCDVTSYYPKNAIVNNIYPEHLGEDFVIVYEGIFKERAKYPKGTSENKTLKLSLNGVFGKTKEEFSFLCDLKYFYTITINGQLMLTKLAEDLTLAGINVIMINTDGLECIVPNHLKSTYINICNEWCKTTKLQLEYEQYKSLYIRDCNNYMGIFASGEYKSKGAYEIDKDVHKDHSFKIVPIAVNKYFYDGTPIEKTITGRKEEIAINNTIYHTTIYNYMGRLKRDSRFDVYNDVLTSKGLTTHKLHRLTRYYVSKDTNSIIYSIEKQKGSRTILNKGFNLKVQNNIESENFEDYKFDLSFYRAEARKLIHNIKINNQQGSLF